MRDLRDLRPGESGTLAEPPARVAQRLLDLGFVAGTSISVVRRGPLGDPIEVELRGYRLALRRADSDGLQVDVSEVAPG